MLLIGEDGAELLGAGLLVLALDDGALVDAHADGDLAILTRVDDGFDLVAVVDVPGVEPDLVHARLDGFQSPLEVEVHIGDDGDIGLGEDLGERLGVLALGDGDADNVGPGSGELVDLGDALLDVVGVPSRHGLDTHGCGGGGGGEPLGERVIGRDPAADLDDPGALVADEDRTGWVSGLHREILGP